VGDTMNTDPALSFMTRKYSALPDCACFELVDDNPYCPLHGKPAEPTTVAEAECALFGNVYQPEGSELHLLEWEREVRETRESDRPL
jgi:hypothetical protein